MFRENYWEARTSVPEMSHNLLPRNNIIKKINTAPLSETIFLVAPYGCGKTMAVLSWLKESGKEAAWVTLNELDNSKETFFASLSAAIMRLSGWQGSMEDILEDSQYIKNPQAYLGEHILIAEKNNCDKVLVIDKFEYIQDFFLLRTIKNLMCGLQRWRTIIIDRMELPPVFNDLLLKRNICRINIKELNFCKEEMGEFFKINGRTATKEEISQVCKETEGWPAALSVILTIYSRGPLRYGDAAREYVKGFFEAEIWRYLEEDMKDFLLKTSILNILTSASCNAVTNMGVSLPVLRRLIEKGLFIYSLDNEESFQYSRVFRNFLQYKFESSGIDRRELYKKVGWWMYERNEYEQAFPYFFNTGDLYGLNQVFRVINSTVMGIDKYLELVSCIITLNEEELRDYPLIIAKMALIQYVLGNISEMQRLIGIFNQLLDLEEISLTPEEYAECKWEAGWLSFLDPLEPIQNNSKHEEWYKYMEGEPRLKVLYQIRTAVYRFPSTLRGIRDYCPVLETIDECVQKDNEPCVAILDSNISKIRFYIIRAEYAYELENFELAEEFVRKVIIEAERRQLMDLYFVCVVLLVKIIRAVHNPDEIGMLESRLKSAILKNGYECMIPTFHAFELRNRLAEGLIGQTVAFESENNDYADNPYFYLFYRQITLVRALLSTCGYNEALMILANQEFLCKRYNRIMDLIEVNILKSVADYKLGYDEGACRHLTKAIDMGRKYGFIRIFSDEAKDIWPILELVGKERNDTYLKSIIISSKKVLARAGINPNQKRKANSDLTKTELRLLKTLDTNMSYKEIALDNNIKVSTVKSHIHSIYAKLDVGNRTSAILVGREIGIIE